MHQRAKRLTDKVRLEIGVIVTVTSAIAVGLIGYLIWAAGPWAVAANTRLLDLLYRMGVVKLTDADQGYWDGAPSHEYFIRSQDVVDWWTLALATAILLAVWGLRSVRFHTLTTAVGIEGAPRRHTRLFLYGEELGRYLPYDLGTTAALAPMTDEDDERPARLASLIRLVQVSEIVFFGLLTMLMVGFAIWFGSMMWALVVLAVATYLTRGRLGVSRRIIGEALRSSRRTISLAALEPSRWTGVIIVTLLAFPLEELVAYLIVQAFTSEHVILGGATPSILLLALVAGKTAQLVRVTPGGIGQFELAFAASLVASGQGVAEAVTITLLFSVLRHVVGAVVLAVTSIGDGPGTSATDAFRLAAGRIASGELPRPALLLRRLLMVALAVTGLMLLNRVRLLLVDYWLFESLGYEQVFWTNFWTGLGLFALGWVAWGAAIAVPARRAGVPPATRRTATILGGLVGVLAGLWWAGRYQMFILASNAVPFGETDPVFSNDVGFYVLQLPAITKAIGGIALVATVATISTVVWRIVTRPRPPGSRLRRVLGAMAATPVYVLLGASGLLWAFKTWLYQFHVLTKDNYESSIANGAEALDVTGLFSTVNGVRVEAIALAGLTISLIVWLARGKRNGFGSRSALLYLGPWLLLAIAFPTAVAVRDVVSVRPNEPVVQLDYIARHIEATNRAWGMDQVELIDFTPNGPGDPLPELERVLEHPSVRNAQLWPAASSWLERLLDPQHVDRIMLAADSDHPDLVFGATLDIFKQQQKLRAYYDFLDADVARYEIAGEPTLVSSAVRELPLLEPHPWLAYWGQRFVLFTHGHGLVMTPMGESGPEGGPAYLSSGIPPVITDPALDPGQHAIYYGEGSGNIGFSNIDGVPELDFPTDQGREDVFLPADVDSGVHLDSWLKRLVFAWGTTELFNSGSFFDVAFSGLITPETRIHYERQPLERIRTLAPFLFLDSDPYAVVGEDSVVWMVNGLTTTDQYPYSAMAELGDKSIKRGPFPTEVAMVNYAADSVKVTVDAYTGKVRFYRISDEPIVASWAAAYPGLFAGESEMPVEIAAHKQFPTQLFHAQFDDLYIYYHVTDALAYFNQEDLFDDADEVLGAMIQQGKGITFSMEPYPVMIEGGVDYPATGEPMQFSLQQIFTPEGALNLRSIVTVYQDGEDYGRLSMLQVPKGHFVHGPEQAEAVIDQDADIAQQFGFWNTTGVEVLRGFMTPIVVDGEVLYVEPVFIRSAQNPFPQLSRVVVVLRGHAVMAPTLDEALTRAWDSVTVDQEVRS